ncbi:MAG: MerR family transcriptional regulator [Pseudomonadota bacterium]
MSEPATSTLFDDGKAPEALRTIGEVANALSIRQHVLRYWEEQFPMLRPLKRSGGRRYYRQVDIALVETIYRLVHREGYTLRGARLVLEGKAADATTARTVQDAPSARAPDRPTGVPAGTEVLSGLRAIREVLAKALDR